MISSLSPVIDIYSNYVTGLDSAGGKEYIQSTRSSGSLTLSELEKTNFSINAAGNSLIELTPPDTSNKNIRQSSKTELTQRLSDAKQGKDIDAAEQAVVCVAAVCGAQMQSGLANLAKRGENNSEKMIDSTSRNLFGTQSINAHSPVLHGTDITAPTPFIYSNVMGSMGSIEAFSSIMKVLNQQEANFNRTAAKWSYLTMSSAHAAGQHIMNASYTRLGGAVAAGGAGSVAQYFSYKNAGNALSAEKKSINKNLFESHRLENNIGTHKNITNSHRDEFNPEAGVVSEEMKNSLSTAITNKKAESSELKDRHNYISLNAQKARMRGDSITQINQSGQRVTESLFEIGSASERKMEELIRANQTVTGSVDNTHQQASKKANDGESALRQALLTILNNNNDAVSAVANRMA